MGSLLRVIKKQVRAKHWNAIFRLVIVGLLVLQGNLGTAAPPQKRPSDKHKITVQTKLSHNKANPGSVLFALLIVDIQDGWHINSANPSDENLVASSVEIQENKVIDSVIVQYPPAMERRFDFSDTPLEVYEGRIRIFVRLKIQKFVRPGSYLIPATVNYQSCSNSVCLAPTFVRVNIPIRVTTEGQSREINKELFEPYPLK